MDAKEAPKAPLPAPAQWSSCQSSVVHCIIETAIAPICGQCLSTFKSPFQLAYCFLCWVQLGDQQWVRKITGLICLLERWRSSSEIQNKRKSKTCSAHCAHLKCPSGCRIRASDEMDWPFGCISFPKWGSFCFAFQNRGSLGQADTFWRFWEGTSRCRRSSWEWSHWSYVYHR